MSGGQSAYDIDPLEGRNGSTSAFCPTSSLNPMAVEESLTGDNEDVRSVLLFNIVDVLC